MGSLVTEFGPCPHLFSACDAPRSNFSADQDPVLSIVLKTQPGMGEILMCSSHALLLDAKDLDQLSRHNITHIISIHDSVQPYIPVSFTTHGGSTVRKGEAYGQEWGRF